MMLTAALLVLAQTAAPLEHRPNAWALITAMGHRAKGSRVRWYVEVQPRFDIAASRFSQVLFRAAIGLDVGAGLSLWVGNAYTPIFNPNYRGELRPFQQVLGQHAFGAFRLINRFRFEQRFIDTIQDVSLRVRYSVRVGYVLGQSRFALAAFNELFVNLNSVANGPAQGLEQNWSFIGLNRTFGDFIVVETGYIAAYVWRSPTPRLNHSAVVWLAFNFP